MIETSRNWAGNYTYRAARIHRPETVEQIQELVVHSHKLKALGTRHSFNDIADSPGDLISLERLNRILSLDHEHLTVTVEAGVRYGELARWLHEHGFALHNLASLPHISVAGACATATHGSGDRHGNLATAVSAMEVVTGSGDVVDLSRARKREQLEGAIVGLGGIGVITRLTLDISPTFQMQQDVYENLPLRELEDRFDEMTSSAYSVSLFTDWRNATFNQVWFKRHVPDGRSIRAEPELFGAELATSHLHPIAGISAENCTEQLGVCGPWFERLPHFRMDFTPSVGEELQSEYILPRQHAFEAFQAIDQIRAQVAPLLQISEVRTIAADTLWMSPCYRQDCVAIHFTWRQDWQGVSRVLPRLEEQLEPFEVRPHWGKLFTMSPARLQSLYEKMPDFRRLVEEYDPQGKFRNEFLDQYIFGAAR
ncbi:MAG TPA: FAD-binding protein [Anaerolineales bacterium]|nr:FAD-binding protein [Anaerolineales bacterium]